MPPLETIECPLCHTKLQIRGSSIGSMIRCKACGGKIHIKQRSWLPGCLGLVAIAVAGVFVCGGFFSGEQPQVAAPPPATPVLPPTPTPEPPDMAIAADPSPPEAAVAIQPDPQAMDLEASKRLKLAETLFRNDKLPTAKSRAQEVVRDYPGTAAAKSAAELIQKIDRQSK